MGAAGDTTIGRTDARHGIRSRRSVQRAHARLALAARHLALGFVRLRQQGNQRRGAEQQDQRETQRSTDARQDLLRSVHLSQYIRCQTRRRQLSGIPLGIVQMFARSIVITLPRTGNPTVWNPAVIK